MNGVLIGLFIFIPYIVINDFFFCSSIHACVLVKVLLRNFCNQEKCPPELYRQSSDMNSMVASVAGEIQIYSVFYIYCPNYWAIRPHETMVLGPNFSKINEGGLHFFSLFNGKKKKMRKLFLKTNIGNQGSKSVCLMKCLKICIVDATLFVLIAVS